MKNLTVVTCITLSIFSAGCAAPSISPVVLEKRNEIQRTIPNCTTVKECNAKWEAAQIWIVKNAGYKIQTVTNVLIETYNPTRSSVELAAQVIKEPLGNGNYQFILKVWCSNMFGCHPNPLDATLSFHRALNTVTQ
jgi:hypothetical protein